MSMTMERWPAAPNVFVRSSRWAWLALLVSLVVYPMAVAAALGQENTTVGDFIFVALMLVPPVAGVLLGVRSARTGNRLGVLATAIESAWLTLIVTFFVGANHIWTGGRPLGPATLAIGLAMVVGGAVEAAGYRFRKTG